MSRETPPPSGRPSRLGEISDLIKAAAWPVLALLALVSFCQPVKRTLENISRNSNDIEDVKLGSLELKIRPEELPTPSAAVAKAVAGLSDEELITLFELHGAHYMHGYCAAPGGTGPPQPGLDALNDLDKRGLITIEKRQGGGDPQCPVEWRASLSDDGVATRRFLVSLIYSQLRNAKPTAS